jgi:cold shock protein
MFYGRSMATKGVVREWHDDDGWGVIDAPEVGDGCWAGFGQVAVDGYRGLEAGQEVALEFEAAPQDGFGYRATRVWPWGAEPVPDRPEPGGAAYSSTLTLKFDG